MPHARHRPIIKSIDLHILVLRCVEGCEGDYRNVNDKGVSRDVKVMYRNVNGKGVSRDVKVRYIKC